jgi:hypothetical protein
MKPVVDGHTVQEFSAKFRPHITQAGKVSVRCNSVQLWNLGTSTVVVDNVFEIPAGAVFQFGDDNLLNIIVQEFNIKFSNNGQQIDKMQLVEIVVDDPYFAHYVERKKR